LRFDLGAGWLVFEKCLACIMIGGACSACVSIARAVWLALGLAERCGKCPACVRNWLSNVVVLPLDWLSGVESVWFAFRLAELSSLCFDDLSAVVCVRIG
jgi:hypothetical protein